VENAYSKFVIPSRPGPKAKTSKESAFLFPLPASEKKTRPFIEIRECRLILLLELARDDEGKNIRQKMWDDSRSGNHESPCGADTLVRRR
jgi:hypothetical protein